MKNNFFISVSTEGFREFPREGRGSPVEEVENKGFLCFGTQSFGTLEFVRVNGRNKKISVFVVTGETFRSGTAIPNEAVLFPIFTCYTGNPAVGFVHPNLRGKELPAPPALGVSYEGIL